ncbi:MAG: hypothetical protein HFI13_15205 [Lachnospiraceae bacterium]|nr:hypothetical protein [Lachnospiraceae bacterium]
MGARVRINLTGDGRRFEQMLRELRDKEVRIGFQREEASEEDGTDICDVAMWNELGTEHAPSRPFLRKSVDENIAKINDFLQDQKANILRGVSAEQILKDIGLFQKDLIQEKITEGNFVPNAVSTIARKGSDHPLIDTGRMRQSVNYVIKQKGDS